MTENPRTWDDLPARIITATALVVFAALSIWMGGVWFVLLCALAVAVMIWELARMLAPDQPAAPYLLGILAAGFSLTFVQGSVGVGIASLIAAPLVGVFWLRSGKLLFASYGLATILAGFSFALMRENFGVAVVMWVVVVVAGADIAGYFAGRYLGGPKLWKRISPKKTWSGAVAGWLVAAGVGLVFVLVFDFYPHLIWLSVLMSLASQIGDLSESAIKRFAGVKDSSNLLPGHGGVLDRFDGLVGAGLFSLVAVVPNLAIPG